MKMLKAIFKAISERLKARKNNYGFLPHLEINRRYARKYKDNCPLIVRDKHYSNLGACWHPLEENGTRCPMHGKIK